MRQPVLVVLDVDPDTDMDQLGRGIEMELRDAGRKVQWAVPVQRTDGVPAGMVVAPRG
jgi:hypothetical protein